jgi:hypothetical protein
MISYPTIGLFGTCGASRWREPFIATYTKLGIQFFNPQVADWTPACAEAENEHFRRDAILLYPVTAETTGFGSLAEVGLAIVEIERSNQSRRPGEARELLIYIDPDCTDPKANEIQIRDSRRTRILVTSKLPAYTGTHVQICSSLDDMLERSVRLARGMSLFQSPPAIPHDRSYWAVPGKLLGGCYPGSEDTAVADAKLTALLEAGVSTFVSLMEPGEKNRNGTKFVPYQPRVAELASRIGRAVECLNFPIPDGGIPTTAHMASILDAIDQRITAGKTVYVHCWGGKGRTGTTVGSYLVRHGLVGPAEACKRLAELTAHSPNGLQPSPENDRQRQFVAQWIRGQ